MPPVLLHVHTPAGTSQSVTVGCASRARDHALYLATECSGEFPQYPGIDTRRLDAVFSYTSLSRPHCIAAALRRGRRKRGADQPAARLREALRHPHLRQDPMVEKALGAQALRLLTTLDTECASVDQLGQATAEAFAQHLLRDAEDADKGGIQDADGNWGESGGVVGEVPDHIGKVPG
jgi:hypothetical protein